MNLYRSALKKRRSSVPLGAGKLRFQPGDGLTVRGRRVSPLRYALVLLLSGLLLIPWAPPQLTVAEEITAVPPPILAIEPEHAYNDQDTPIAIRGAGFVEGVQVLAQGCDLDTQMLADVTVLSSSILTATIPAGWPEGRYSLTAINPDDQKGESFSALAIMRRGDASFGPWTLTTSLISGRSDFVAVATDKNLYAIGNNSFDRAAILPDGSLGTWQFVGPLRTSRTKLAAVMIGNALYVLGGEGISFGSLRNVERVTINPDGSLGLWQGLSQMTTPRAELVAVAVGRYLYALGGYPYDHRWLTSVERAELKLDGTLGPWQPVASTTMVVSDAVVFGPYIYALGFGNTSIERSQVLPDGSLTPWQVVSSTTTRSSGAAIVTAGGYLYMLGGGGCFSFNLSTNSVERAAVYGDGTLGAWEPTASMWSGRSDFAAVVVGQRIYALGGMGNIRTVEYAPARTRLDHSCFLPVVAR